MCDTICAVMTRDDFQCELEALHNEAMRIIQVGLSFDWRAYTPCEEALYDEMIGMLNARIRNLQMRANVFVAFTRIEYLVHLPSPRLVNVKKSLINFDKENRK